jgi:hypothetical protein
MASEVFSIFFQLHKESNGVGGFCIVEKGAENELFCQRLRKNDEIYRIVMKQTEHLVYD